MDSKNVLSIWLVVGVSLLVNGLLILGAGLYELAHPPVHPVVLYQYHASIWLGAVLTLFGGFYTYRFAPRHKKQAAPAEVAAKEIHA
jgi:FtsH-binding integral membrane protein